MLIARELQNSRPEKDPTQHSTGAGFEAGLLLARMMLGLMLALTPGKLRLRYHSKGHTPSQIALPAGSPPSYRRETEAQRLTCPRIHIC